MHSFLIASKNKKNANDYVNNLCNREKINPMDINLQTYAKAMGIEDVRNIQKSILLKPFRGNAKAVVIQAYENITQEAQNALLKVLEEPPANTIIIISVSRKELVLPTIISRCKIIELKENELNLTSEDFLQISNALNMILNGKIGSKLKIAQDIAGNKEETAAWFEKMIIFVREKLIENYNDPKYLEFLKQLQQAYKNIKSTNVNKRVALENLFLSS